MNLPLMMTSKNVDINKPATYKPKNSIIQDLIDFINRQTPNIYNEKK